MRPMVARLASAKRSATRSGPSKTRSSCSGAIAEQDVLGLGEAAELAGVSKSTAYRLLATLEVAGLAERLPESGYRAGVEAMRWASRLLAGLDVRTVALPALQAPPG